jgi:hypothetical protein
MGDYTEHSSHFVLILEQKSNYKCYEESGLRIMLVNKSVYIYIPRKRN